MYAACLQNETYRDLLRDIVFESKNSAKYRSIKTPVAYKQFKLHK